jgi:hypothetical protein
VSTSPDITTSKREEVVDTVVDVVVDVVEEEAFAAVDVDVEATAADAVSEDVDEAATNLTKMLLPSVMECCCCCCCCCYCVQGKVFFHQIFFAQCHENGNGCVWLVHCGCIKEKRTWCMIHGVDESQTQKKRSGKALTSKYRSTKRQEKTKINTSNTNYR